MNALSYILDKWDLNPQQPMPIQILDANRTILAKLFNELGYRLGAEIGTLVGTNAKTLKTNNLELILYCIDSWDIYDGIQYFTDPKRMKEFYEGAVQRMSNYKNVHFIKKLSMDAVKDFKDNSLDFVHIDANHELPYVTDDIYHWSKKVRPGGIVSGHDYFLEGQQDQFKARADNTGWRSDVREAAHNYTEEHNINPWFIIDKCIPDRTGTFFWVKP